MSNPKSKSLPSVFSMFFIMLAVYCLDIFLFESDLTVLGEAFYSSVLSLAVLFLFVQASKSKLSVLGLGKPGQKVAAGLIIGAILSIVPFLSVLVGECIAKGKTGIVFLPPSLVNLNSEEGIPPNVAATFYIFTAFLAVLIEELFFRGLMLKKLKKVTSFAKANLIQSVFYMTFGALVTARNVVKGYLAGESLKLLLAAFALCVFCEVLSGIKWGLMTRISGAIYISVVDHYLFAFFANSIFIFEAYTLFELMLRMAAIQVISFAAVFIYYAVIMKKILKKKAEKERIKEANRKRHEEKREEKNAQNKSKIDGISEISPSKFKELAIGQNQIEDIETVTTEKLSDAEIDKFLKNLSREISVKDNEGKKSTEITEDFDTDVFLKDYSDTEGTMHRHRHHSHHRVRSGNDNGSSAEKSTQKEKKTVAEEPKKTLMQMLIMIGAVDDSSANDLI